MTKKTRNGLPILATEKGDLMATVDITDNSAEVLPSRGLDAINEK